MIQRFFSRARLRSARRHLAEEFSAENYARLIHQLAVSGELQSAAELCTEGLGHFPGDRTLVRLEQRVQRTVRERRLARLRIELAQGPRPALWRSYCELCGDAGEWDEALRAARSWFDAGGDGQAQLLIAHLSTRRFLADRSRAAGEVALSAIAAAKNELPQTEEPLRLELRLALAVGAYGDARRVTRELLELYPGDADLEARHRSLEGPAQSAPDLRRALVRVEESGRLATDRAESATLAGEDLRPALQQLASAPGCGAALFLRGATALVQGPRGATAQRTARGVKAALRAASAASRRLDLGPLRELEIEGDFGELVGVVGERDCAAGWFRRAVQPSERDVLRELAGAPLEHDDGGEL
jgi:tetratricopeptide (TPR) repeat protein